jgi:O-antigen ligase
MGAGIAYSLFLALAQRYGYGAVRAIAAFSHPNSLAMAANLVLPVALALVLASKRVTLASIAVACAPVCVVLTLSRGALVISVVAIGLVFAGSLWRKVTSRKLVVAATVLAMGFAVAFKSYDTLVERFTSAPPQSEHARLLFNMAAKAMLSEHPFGVGINQYSHVLGNHGYADRLGIPPIDREGLAHHVYWLTAAETGYFGLASYLLMLAAPLWVALRQVRARGTRGDLALGISVSLALMYAHGTAEWIARQTGMAYLFWALAAICVGMERHAEQRASQASQRETRFRELLRKWRGTPRAREGVAVHAISSKGDRDVRSAIV